MHLSSNSFSDRLFMTVALLFLTFVVFFVGYQYRRERVYKIDLLDGRLQEFNYEMYAGLWTDGGTVSVGEIGAYVLAHPHENLRVSVIDGDGKVIYDNRASADSLPNHADRREIAGALRDGHGYDIKRTSQTLNRPYFYSATYFDESKVFIRSALPYDLTLGRMLSSDKGFIWVALLLTVILLAIYYIFSKELGQDSENEKTRLKRQLTQNIAHELKTPVSSVQGYLETIVTDKDMDEDTRRQFIERAYAQGSRLTNLMRDITLLTRLDEAAESFDKEPVNVWQVVEGIVAESAPALEERGMRMLNIVDKSAVVSGNPSLIYSIFRNLTDNSIAYAGEGTTISVKSVPTEGNLLKFSFEDNGVGVAREHLGRLFERFYRVDKGRSRKLGGTGLGLAIVKNAVQTHGGTIKAQTAESGGLRFIFTLSVT